MVIKKTYDPTNFRFPSWKIVKKNSITNPVKKESETYVCKRDLYKTGNRFERSFSNSIEELENLNSNRQELEWLPISFL